MTLSNLKKKRGKNSLKLSSLFIYISFVKMIASTEGEEEDFSKLALEGKAPV